MERRIRLVVQDNCLSRSRSPVRLWYAVPKRQVHKTCRFCFFTLTLSSCPPHIKEKWQNGISTTAQSKVCLTPTYSFVLPHRPALVRVSSGRVLGCAWVGCEFASRSEPTANLHWTYPERSNTRATASVQF